MMTTLITAILITGSPGPLRQDPPIRHYKDLSAAEEVLWRQDLQAAEQLLQVGRWQDARQQVDRWIGIGNEEPQMSWLLYRTGLKGDHPEWCVHYSEPWFFAEVVNGDQKTISIETRMNYARAIAAFGNSEQAAAAADFARLIAEGKNKGYDVTSEFIKGDLHSVLRDTTIVFANIHGGDSKTIQCALEIAIKKYPDDPELSFFLANRLRKPQPRRALTLMRNATNSKVARIQREAKYQVTCLEWQISKFGDNPPPGG